MDDITIRRDRPNDLGVLPDKLGNFDLRSYHYTEEFSDVNLITKNGSVKAHKLVLGAVSNVLCQAFNQSQSENQVSVHLPDFNLEDVSAFLCVLYGISDDLNSINQDLIQCLTSRSLVQKSDELEDPINETTEFNEENFEEDYQEETNEPIAIDDEDEDSDFEPMDSEDSDDSNVSPSSNTSDDSDSEIEYKSEISNAQKRALQGKLAKVNFYKIFQEMPLSRIAVMRQGYKYRLLLAKEIVDFDKRREKSGIFKCPVAGCTSQYDNIDRIRTHFIWCHKRALCLGCYKVFPLGYVGSHFSKKHPDMKRQQQGKFKLEKLEQYNLKRNTWEPVQGGEPVPVGEEGTDLEVSDDSDSDVKYKSELTKAQKKAKEIKLAKVNFYKVFKEMPVSRIVVAQRGYKYRLLLAKEIVAFDKIKESNVTSCPVPGCVAKYDKYETLKCHFVSGHKRAMCFSCYRVFPLGYVKQHFANKHGDMKQHSKSKNNYKLGKLEEYNLERKSWEPVHDDKLASNIEGTKTFFDPAFQAMPTSRIVVNDHGITYRQLADASVGHVKRSNELMKQKNDQGLVICPVKHCGKSRRENILPKHISNCHRRAMCLDCDMVMLIDRVYKHYTECHPEVPVSSTKIKPVNRHGELEVFNSSTQEWESATINSIQKNIQHTNETPETKDFPMPPDDQDMDVDSKEGKQSDDSQLTVCKTQGGSQKDIDFPFINVQPLYRISVFKTCHKQRDGN